MNHCCIMRIFVAFFLRSTDQDTCDDELVCVARAKAMPERMKPPSETRKRHLNRSNENEKTNKTKKFTTVNLDVKREDKNPLTRREMS
ncbi:Uncharacterized protein APZ42_011369 [Daphnia magna]|uniref:Secreted protein n=1 Tax=Daphnia magna TaxID=35525 RepID=A0A162SLR6_9CRUS|nr:Uncharacterized protein APZ42_011369 [Daphnia magna]